MFTWICPRCGREVPPSYNECPDCAERQRVAETRTATATEAPETPRVAVRPPKPKKPPEQKEVPGWLLSVLFALGFLVLGTGGYYAYKNFSLPSRNAVSGPKLQSPPPPQLPDPKTGLVQRYVEVTGIRLLENPEKKTEVQFLLVNHSGAEIADIAGTVTLKPRSEKPDEKPVGTFDFRVPSIGPYESKEARSILDTPLRPYEIPDWQFLVVDVQIKAP